MNDPWSDLCESGFCIVDGGLGEAALQELRDWSDNVIATTDHSERWKYQGSDIWRAGKRNTSRRNPDLPQDEIVDRLIEHTGPVLESLGLGDFRSQRYYQIISKAPGAPALYWHQDWARWRDPISLSPWPQQIFLNWYLTDTRPENGCLRVIPGSHRHRMDIHERLVPPHEGGGYSVSETNQWMFFDHPDAVDVTVEPGQLVIADARLLHATHPNESTERRTVLLCWYFRRGESAPDRWRGQVPNEIRLRDPDTPVHFDREPGEYLRP
jgi:hypothetical protein